MVVVAGNAQTSRYDSFVVGMCGHGRDTHERVITTRSWCAVDGGGGREYTRTSHYDSFVV
jgi:hypothetical protein